MRISDWSSDVCSSDLFYAYAPEKWEYPINRYAMETKRIFDVADKRLAETRFLAGDDYTIADIATFPWLAPFTTGLIYEDAKTFLGIDEYKNVGRWVKEIRSEEHTSELQSLMRISYAVFCLKKKNIK